MRNNGKFSRLAWLLIIAAFVATAGGGCVGSSSRNNGGGGEVVVGNVTELNRAEHPLADEMRKVYSDMPKGTIFISEKLTGEQLDAAKDELRAAYEDGRIIGMYAPTRARIEKLHDALGVDIFRKRTEADDAPDPEFYMIKLHDGFLFQNRQHYVGKDTQGATFYQRGPLEMSGDKVISGDEAPVPVEPVGDKSDAYPRIAAAVAAWNGLVAEHATKAAAESASARDALRAAADTDYLDILSRPTVTTNQIHFADQDPPDIEAWLPLGGGWGRNVPLEDDTSSNNKECKYKFPTIYITTTMYSCYSFQEDANYYLVLMDAGMNTAGNYHHWFWGLRGCDYEQNAARRYYSRPKMQYVSDPDDQNKLRLLDHQPQASSSSYSGEVNFNLGGSVGFVAQGPNGPVDQGLSDGIDIGSQKQFYINNYVVQDNTEGAKPWTEYVFDIPPQADRHFGYMSLEEGSGESRNFNSEELWIWRVARSEKDAYSFAHNFSYDLLLVQSQSLVFWYIEGYPYTSWEAGSTQGYAIDLPVPPTLALSASELTVDEHGRSTGVSGPATFDLFSNGDWTLESDADWVRLSDEHGGKTARKAIAVMVASNTTNDAREATITATGTPDPNGVPQTTSIVIKQKGRN